jgi:VWFA-related protein
MKILLASLLAIGAGATQAAIPAAAQLVYVDVIASDPGGRPVEDLRLDDFQVELDGSVETIHSVRFVRADPGPPDEALPPIRSREDEVAEAAREGARVVAFFLDEFHVTPGESARRARELIARFVTAEMGPRDLLLVVKPLDSLVNLRGTRDREAVLAALAGFEGRRGDYRARTAFEQSIIAGTPERIDAVRAQISTSALNAIAVHLGGLGSQRKTMIVVSEGFTPPAASRRRGSEALPTLDTAIRSANRGQVSVYPLDPRALSASGAAGAPSAGEEAQKQSLRRLAEETDGYAVLAPGEVEIGLSRVVTDSSAYYLVAMEAAGLEGTERLRGRFRPIQVRVRRPDVRLRAREGVWQPGEAEALLARLSAVAEPVDRPIELPRRRSALIRPWFGMARGDGGRTRVTFVWEPAAQVPGVRERAPEPVRITLKALAPDGASRFEGAIAPANPGPSPGGPAQAVFEAAPGRIRVEMAIEDDAARVIDTDVRDIVVGAFDGPVEIGSPRVMRARSALEYRTIAGDPEAVPVASRTFSRTERLLIRVPAYAAAGPPVVTASLASDIGGVMRDLPVAPGPLPGLYEIEVRLASLPAGEYSVRIAARSGDMESAEVVAFRVTP